MQCIVMCVNDVGYYLSDISSDTYIFNFGDLSSGHLVIYVIKRVRLGGYFWKPKGVLKQNVLENTI
jgi:hypothetical protein